MAAFGDAIAQPLTVDVTGALTSPLSFMLTPVPAPRIGLAVGKHEGELIKDHNLWGYVESRRRTFGDHTLWQVQYTLHRDANDDLLLYCLDDYFDPFYLLMRDPEVGNNAAAIVARHMPTNLRLLLAGCSQGGLPAMVRVTTTKPQWAIALLYPRSYDEGWFETWNRFSDNAMAAAFELASIDDIKHELVALVQEKKPRSTMKWLRVLRGAIGLGADLVGLSEIFGE